MKASFLNIVLKVKSNNKILKEAIKQYIQWIKIYYIFIKYEKWKKYFFYIDIKILMWYKDYINFINS